MESDRDLELGVELDLDFELDLELGLGLHRDSDVDLGLDDLKNAGGRFFLHFSRSPFSFRFGHSCCFVFKSNIGPKPTCPFSFLFHYVFNTLFGVTMPTA